MTQNEWQDSADPLAMIAFLRSSGGASDRKLRLFACACCRRLWHVWGDLPGERRAVEAAERFAEGLADARELGAAGYASEPVPLGGQGEGGAGHNCTRADAWDAARVVSEIVWE